MPTELQSTVVLDVGIGETILSYKTSNDLWMQGAGVVNLDGVAGLNIALSTDDPPANPRFLKGVKQQNAGNDPFVWTGWMFLPAGEFVLAFIWGSLLNDRIRFWVETLRA